MTTTTRILATLAVILLLAGCSTATTTTSNTPAAVSVTISGGLDTDLVDNGRPVVLIAAALGVPAGVFRDAFSGVTPASDGDGPTGAEAQANKAALLAVLGPYGITNDELDAVSNQYRYLASAGELWPHTDATAEAVVKDGVVTGVRVIDGGSGYTSAPTITLSTGQTATATLGYGTDFATNGTITAITLD
jgi:uncharacterized protein YceK